jgi:hypothetical protein
MFIYYVDNRGGRGATAPLKPPVFGGGFLNTNLGNRYNVTLKRYTSNNIMRSFSLLSTNFLFETPRLVF